MDFQMLLMRKNQKVHVATGYCVLIINHVCIYLAITRPINKDSDDKIAKYVALYCVVTYLLASLRMCVCLCVCVFV